jgi:hypothetical protein
MSSFGFFAIIPSYARGSSPIGSSLPIEKPEAQRVDPMRPSRNLTISQPTYLFLSTWK